MAYIETNRPISAIFVNLVNQFTTLVRKEGQLARAEILEKLGEIGIGLGLIVGGCCVANPGSGDSARGGSRRLGCCRACRGVGQPGGRWGSTVDRACLACPGRQPAESRTPSAQ